MRPQIADKLTSLPLYTEGGKLLKKETLSSAKSAV